MPMRGRSQFEGPTVMFVSTMIIGWEPLFRDPETRDRVQEILFGCVDVTDASLLAYCIMKHHVHLLVGHPKGGAGTSKFVGGFKSLVARRLFPDRKHIWRKRFDDVVIVSQAVFDVKLNYIHDNPVRAGYVSQQAEWPWSSARYWLQDLPHDHLTRTWDWVDARGTMRQSATRGRVAGT